MAERSADTVKTLQQALINRGIEPNPKWNKEQLSRRLDAAIKGEEAPGSQGAVWPETHLPHQPEGY